jgi:transcriptional regulator with XRE-family HTH domain
MMPREEDQVNGDKLRQLREARGWDGVQLARLSSLSVAQVQALEDGGTDCFYSIQIKKNAARKLAKVLGVPDDTVIHPSEPSGEQIEEPLDPQPVPELAVINSRSLYSKSYPSTWVGYIAMTLSLVAGLVWFALRPLTSASRPSWVTADASTSASQVQGSVEADKSRASTAIAAPVAPAAVAPALALEAAPVPLRPLSVSPKPNPEGTEIMPAALTVSAVQACPFDGDAAVFEATNPTKSAEKLSLMFHKAGVLCVQDSTGKVWQEELKPWLGRTFIGKAPWKLYSSVLPHADVYFQGEKIKLAVTQSRTIALNGKEFNP